MGIFIWICSCVLPFTT